MPTLYCFGNCSIADKSVAYLPSLYLFTYNQKRETGSLHSSNRWKLDTYLITRTGELRRKEERKRERKKKRKNFSESNFFFRRRLERRERYRYRERETSTANACFFKIRTGRVSTEFEKYRNFLVARVINRGMDKFSIKLAFEIREKERRGRKRKEHRCNATHATRSRADRSRSRYSRT